MSALLTNHLQYDWADRQDIVLAFTLEAWGKLVQSAMQVQSDVFLLS